MNYNCADIFEKFAKNLKYNDFLDFIDDVETGFKNDWSKDYAYLILTLAEEPYRDYNAIWQDLFAELKSLAPKAEFKSCHVKNTSKKSYTLEYSMKNSGMWCEIFLYHNKNMQKYFDEKGKAEEKLMAEIEDLATKLKLPANKKQIGQMIDNKQITETKEVCDLLMLLKTWERM